MLLLVLLGMGGTAADFRRGWGYMGQVGVGVVMKMGRGLKCYDTNVYIETPAVHIDCNMNYVK